MKIVVTGANGRLGRYAIKELLGYGHQIIALDKFRADQSQCPTVIVDLTDAVAVSKAMEGADAVLHLARENFPYTHEGFDPYTRTWKIPDTFGDARRFQYNVEITYNVLAAAFEAGIKKIVTGASLTAYGFYYPARRFVPEYLPIDEAHALKPQDPYSISKAVGEQICDGFVRKSDMATASLRFAGITTDLTHQVLLERRSDPLRWTGALWSYIDVRDAAIACRLALEAQFKDHQKFNICASTTFMNTPTLELVRRFLPDVTRLKSGLHGNWSGYDAAKARDVLGFEARFLLQR